MHPLGCTCFPLLRPYNHHKLAPRSETCAFLGYSTIHKGYYCYHIPSQRLYVSRHVIFNDKEFPFSAIPVPTDDVLASHPSASTTPLVVLPPPLLNPTPTQSSSSVSPTQSPSAQPDQSISTSSSSNDHFTPSPPSHRMVTRSQTQSLKPRTYPHHQVYHTFLSSDKLEPTCYTQASKSVHWRNAMAAELTALAHNHTWTLVPPPPQAHIIGAKWVFKLKLKADGTIDRYKARLVAKGYHQQEGIDYTETFSPVVKPVTVRVVLTLALASNWPIQQLDVNNAFLHGDLNETVYMEQPAGFVDPVYPNHVCQLHKALYGLKQAPRAWFSKLRSFLLSQNFVSAQSDHSLFVYHSNGVTIYLLVYVDDILITGNNSQAIQDLILTLGQKFSIKTLGSINYFLGIEVNQVAFGLHLSQSRYLLSILERASMSNAKLCNTPLPTGVQVSRFTGTPLPDPQLYRSIVGALQYATVTRPDLTFAVNRVSQFMASPTEEHWKLVKRILRYVQGTLHLGLTLTSSLNPAIHAFCDADWAGCPDDRRSTTGFAIFLGPNLVSWSSKKQSTVSRSSTEAEYRSLAVTTSEVLWLNSLLAELHALPAQPPTLWCDNLGATFLASNPVFHARTKHIELDVHFIREKVANRQLAVKFICSADQLGDFFTKSLPRARFEALRDKLHVSIHPCRLRGPVEENTTELDRSSDDELETTQVVTVGS